MRIIRYCAVCVILTALIMTFWGNIFSENSEVQTIVKADRDLNPPFGAGPLVSIVWYKALNSKPYKIFSNQRDIKDIHYYLEYKGLKSTAQNKTLDISKENTLAFVYYSNKKNSYRMRYVPFQIVDGVFCWPYGKDKKTAEILMNKERWEQSFDHIDPSGRNYLNKKKKVQEKLGVDAKYKKINQIRRSLADKEQKDQHELKLFNTCDLAKQNLMAIVSFSMQEETLNDILLELNKNELSESIVHAFVQLPKFITEDYSKFVKPEYIKIIRQFSEKYDDEGLSREEQVELFQAHQEINKQILDELQRIQDDFEEILQIKESQ